MKIDWDHNVDLLGEVKCLPEYCRALSIGFVDVSTLRQQKNGSLAFNCPVEGRVAIITKTGYVRFYKVNGSMVARDPMHIGVPFGKVGPNLVDSIEMYATLINYMVENETKRCMKKKQNLPEPVMTLDKYLRQMKQTQRSTVRRHTIDPKQILFSSNEKTESMKQEVEATLCELFEEQRLPRFASTNGPMTVDLVRTEGKTTDLVRVDKYGFQFAMFDGEDFAVFSLDNVLSKVVEKFGLSNDVCYCKEMNTHLFQMFQQQ